MSKKIFTLPVEYTVCSTVNIAADSIEEALEIYERTENEIGFNLDPLEAEYLDESYKLSYAKDEIVSVCKDTPDAYARIGNHGVDEDGNVY